MTNEETKLVEIDPMAVRIEKLKAEAIQLKIERTGLKESYCYRCKNTLSIEHFTIHRTGSKRNKDNKSTKQRKNTPLTPWAPRRECNKCLVEKKKINGQYDKDLANKREIYKKSDKLRESLKDAAIKARDILADSYIKKLLKAQGYTTKQIEDNPNLIKDKRKEVMDKRTSAAKKTYENRKKTGFYAKRERSELRTSYLKRCIRNSKGYDGREITDEMIAKKKAELLHERANGDKAWVVRKTIQQKNENKKAVSSKRIKTLSNVYIRACIKRSVQYQGEEITDEMIEQKKKEILELREKKKSGITLLPKSDRLTNGYVKDLISRATGIPRDKITQEEVDLKKKQVIERRVQLFKEAPLRKIKKQERKERREHREDLMLLAGIKRAQERIQNWREKEQRELAEKQEKERKKLLKKERKAVAKKSKRLEKKLQKQQKANPYTFFISHDIRA